MKINLYAFKDTKIAFKNPFLLQNDQVALRMLKQLVNDNNPNNEIRRNAEDIELWKLGSFNDETGEINSEVKFIAKAIDYKEV